ncbi:flagellar motor protein MotB [Alkalilimnicola ehrlichii]|uniref:Flagellar motor protein MotB n=1 Tax=Alkalilimnicola ehrlichii TaxID=351052 RepID=A0A3E0WMH9_9GAMM|nr:OmpA family protein [Alkalilimnicola ehrlichii]RFA26281.1 flagellar motor protein MotB [Alkalilimnicola ehrlichii]RFA33267.1 flagellar motor protein MotB [Alkalilimnicola ehrlichii]
MAKYTRFILASALLLLPVAAVAGEPAFEPAPANAGTVREARQLGEAVERQLPHDGAYRQWVQDEAVYEEDWSDRIEQREVVEILARTVKLRNVVPPIPFGSGDVEIPPAYVEQLRDVLAEIKDRDNVRLHFVGHSDVVPLSASLEAVHRDNLGLSRERAGAAAEFFLAALDLPPEAVSFEGRGELEPLASNATEAGRSMNRRVEVEVWYDEMEEQLAAEPVVVPRELHRVQVCRAETVCLLRYKEEHSQRARVKNLVPPLHYGEDAVSVPESFRQQILQTLDDLQVRQGRRNVVVRFVGYADNSPLEGRDLRIYGDHLALSRAQARRVALTVQEALLLPSHSVESDGLGSARPVASNETASGRAMNRRIEVEFWYDDPLQELPDGPQLCPQPGNEETVTRVYDPPSGPLEAIPFQGGRPVVTPAYLQRLGEVMAEIGDRENVRVRLIGYTANRPLDRRTAMAYGDDIGLSTARALRVSELVKEGLALSDREVEHEGRGYVQSPDVVNAGFIESDTSRVEVQVVYDEAVPLNDLDALDITPVRREVTPVDPFALNLMRITVDGQPLDDPNKSMQDVQRCTDVAFDQADIRFKFDSLALKPRLNVTAWPNTLRYQDDPETEFPDNLVRFEAYSNYPAFIARSEVRIFDAERSTRDEPLAVVPLGDAGRGEWLPHFEASPAPRRELKYVLRVYDEAGRFDETAPQALWVIDSLSEETRARDAQRELRVGYGENRLALQNIPLTGGTITVHGSDIPPDHTVWVAGEPVPVGAEHDFIAEKILPAGLHTVEVAVLDAYGSGELFLRDLELKRSDWFYVGIADLTVSHSDTSGPAGLVSQKDIYDSGLSTHGRLAGYVRGKFGNDWQLTASADTLEGPVEDLFSNFMDKSPDALFRRIDPDYHYPSYGDDSTVEEGAPTLGKFYLKLQQGDNYGLWGNFKVAYVDNSLAHVDRGLYGANVHLRSADTTSFGEQRFMVDGFAAQPGTAASRDEFRGTGGSLYYLRHQDILMGSERVRVEVRDRDSGLVVAVKNLVPGLDYSIDYLQGRIVLARPLSGTAEDDLLIDTGAGAGNEAYLVARYEYTPGFEELDTLSSGGRVHYWFGDHLRLGMTANRDSDSDETSQLGGVDVIVRRNAQTWLKLEGSRSEGAGIDTLHSVDGGFSFGGSQGLVEPGERANAYRVDASLALSDLHPGTQGRATLYHQHVGAGYSAPGLITDKDTDKYGGSLVMPLTDNLSTTVKTDHTVQRGGLDTAAAEVNLDYALDAHWTLGTGMRYDSRKDKSPEVPLTQREGNRTDAVVRATYDTRARWMSFGYVQETVNTTGNRESNARVGGGGAYRLTDRFTLNAEASTGDLGEAGRLGAEFLYSDRTTFYANYGLENERTDNGLRARRGNLASGFRTHYSDTASVYVEERYTHGDVPTGLTHSAGVDLAPADRWTFGISGDYGTLRDNNTSAEIQRRAVGVRVGYGFETVKLSSAVEYREDKLESEDLSVSERSSWLLKNRLRYQLNPDWRFLGKFDYAYSESSQGAFYDGRYTEAVAGYAYRPVHHDRLNALFKYTYFYNLPSSGQVTGGGTTASFVQKSHIVALDALYDLTPRWSVGGKYAYRHGQLAMDRDDPEFFSSRAHLYIARADWRFVRHWSGLMEARLLDLPDAGDSRSGALVAVYRHFGDNFRLGAGYNFAEFSDDLTNLDYDHQGFFINMVGAF